MATIKTPELKVPASLMQKIGLKEKELIRQDSLNGISQNPNGEKFGNYRSPQYAKYKQNWMNRFTDKAGNKGTKLKSLTGQPVVSNQTGFVNMTLTGQMATGLHIESVKENEVTMSYLPKDAGKIIGNKTIDVNREVVGLNNKNIDIIGDVIFEELSKQVDDWAREDINITITI